jgi:hypothetical protein
MRGLPSDDEEADEGVTRQDDAEDQSRGLGVRLNAEPALERAEIVEGLVDDRQSDDRVNQIAGDAREHAYQQRGRVADPEHDHVDADILRPVEEEDHTEEEEQMVVAGDHVLGAQVDERQEDHAGRLLDIALVAVGDPMGQGLGEGAVNQQQDQNEEKKDG